MVIKDENKEFFVVCEGCLPTPGRTQEFLSVILRSGKRVCAADHKVLILMPHTFGKAVKGELLFTACVRPNVSAI